MDAGASLPPNLNNSIRSLINAKSENDINVKATVVKKGIFRDSKSVVVITPQNKEHTWAVANFVATTLVRISKTLDEHDVNEFSGEDRQFLATFIQKLNRGDIDLLTILANSQEVLVP